MKTLLLAVATLVGATTVVMATPTNLIANSSLDGTNDYFYSPSNSNVNEVTGWTLGGYGFVSYPGKATNSIRPVPISALPAVRPTRFAIPALARTASSTIPMG